MKSFLFGDLFWFTEHRSFQNPRRSLARATNNATRAHWTTVCGGGATWALPRSAVHCQRACVVAQRRHADYLMQICYHIPVAGSFCHCNSTLLHTFIDLARRYWRASDDAMLSLVLAGSHLHLAAAIPTPSSAYYKHSVLRQRIYGILHRGHKGS